ncbi:MAG: hypothetical protein KDH96_09495 [Candidatus Riesia sp.]|nr:hypothetical protein [Candidatus Riesia sp.]
MIDQLTNDKYYRLKKGAEDFILSKKFEDAYRNYKAMDEIKKDDNISEKIKKLERYIDLKKGVNSKKAEYDYNKAMQLALKLVLNGTYGAFANRYFVLSNSKIANAITAMGRNVIQYMLEKIEDYFYNTWHSDYETHKLLGLEYLATKDGNYSFLNRNYDPIDRPYSQINTGDINNDILMSRNIPLSRLKKIEPYEKNGWSILYEYHIHNFNNIKEIDPDSEWEYIDENRVSNPDEIFKTYKGKNPILIYGDTDSLYLSYLPIMKSCDYNGNELELIFHVDKVFVKGLFNKFLNEYASPYGVENKHDFELETINRSAIHLEKKHYINNVVWEDGIFYNNLSYFFPKGVEIVRSSTPSFVRGKNQQGGIWDFIRYIFTNPDSLDIRDVLKLVKEQRRSFEMDDIENISMNTSCTNYEDKVIDDVNSVETTKGAHFSIKAAAFHNYLLNKNSEYKTKYDLIKSGKIKYYYCDHPINNVFAYLRSFHPYEVTEKEGVVVDYETQFDKCYLTLVNKFLEPLGLPLINKRLSFLNSLLTIKK